MPSETLQSCIVNAATRLGTISTIASIDFQARRAHLVHDGRNLADICADRPQTSIKLMEAPAPISESSYILLVALSLPIETRLFRLRHRIAIRKRAQQIARMVTFISYNLQTKDYDRFVASFSNPWKKPDASERRRPVNFVFRCGFRRLAGTTRLLNIPMVLLAHLTFTSAGAATIGVSSLAAALKPSIG